MAGSSAGRRLAGNGHYQNDSGKRVAGQVSAIQRMIDEDAYCVDVLTQVAAASGALGKVGHIILDPNIGPVELTSHRSARA